MNFQCQSRVNSFCQHWSFLVLLDCLLLYAECTAWVGQKPGLNLSGRQIPRIKVESILQLQCQPDSISGSGVDQMGSLFLGREKYVTCIF